MLVDPLPLLLLLLLLLLDVVGAGVGDVGAPGGVLPLQGVEVGAGVTYKASVGVGGPSAPEHVLRPVSGGERSGLTMHPAANALTWGHIVLPRWIPTGVPEQSVEGFQVTTAGSRHEPVYIILPFPLSAGKQVPLTKVSSRSRVPV